MLIFLVTFAIASIFSKPETSPLRSICLAIFVVITGISNHQHYSFLQVADTVLILTLTSTALAIAAYIPFQPGAERGFRRQMKRYFRSCDYLMTDMGRYNGQKPGLLQRLQNNFHTRQILLLPRKMGMWIPHIQSPGDTDQKGAVKDLINNLQVLSYRIVELAMVRHELQSGDIIEELKLKIADWRLEVQKTLQQMGEDPAVVSFSSFGKGQEEIMDNLDKRVETLIDNPENQQIDTQGVEVYYQLLGGYRGVAMALGSCTKRADAIDWQPFDPDEN
ncbi:MAG: hypothetical protein KAH12_10690, partial [Anaerolineales bacterium]|nr:hypothetical protein [Anaerolineales bacterium]